jgi:hypothetical protein
MIAMTRTSAISAAPTIGPQITTRTSSALPSGSGDSWAAPAIASELALSSIVLTLFSANDVTLLAMVHIDFDQEIKHPTVIRDVCFRGNSGHRN